MSNQTMAPQALPANTILAGKYLVERCVGSGGFGITYRAKDLRPGGGLVAIKEYFPRAVASRGDRGVVRISDAAAGEFRRWRENYEREYTLLAKLKGNQAIINVRETFRENDTSYLVMDFIPGKTLEARVREEGPMDGQAVMELLRPFLPELARMHHKGILHRDINPGNIMLPPGEMPKLIDFGSARPVPRDNARLTALLRPGFAPPEQYNPAGKQDPATDVYGLCASLYFALTGVTPPDGRQRVLRDDLVPLSTLCKGPDRLVNAVTRGLELDPSRRPASFESLWHDLFPASNADGQKARIHQDPPSSPSPSPTAGGEAGRHLAARAAAAKRVAKLLKPLNPELYSPLLELARGLEAHSSPAARDRVLLEEAILERGPLCRVLCALLTRKGG